MSHSYTLSDEEKKVIDELRDVVKKASQPPIKELTNEQKAHKFANEAENVIFCNQKIDFFKKAVHLYAKENLLCDAGYYQEKIGDLLSHDSYQETIDAYREAISYYSDGDNDTIVGHLRCLRKIARLCITGNDLIVALDTCDELYDEAIKALERRG